MNKIHFILSLKQELELLSSHWFYSNLLLRLTLVKLKEIPAEWLLGILFCAFRWKISPHPWKHYSSCTLRIKNIFYFFLLIWKNRRNSVTFCSLLAKSNSGTPFVLKLRMGPALHMRHPRDYSVPHSSCLPWTVLLRMFCDLKLSKTE